MSPPSDDTDDKRAELRRQVLGLGERSFRKTWYPELQERLVELERFRALLDRSFEGILVADVQSYRIIDANRTALLLLNLSKERLLRMSLSDLMPSPVIERLVDATTTERMVAFEVTWPTAKPDVELETFVEVTQVEAAKYAVIFVKDVTIKHKVEYQALTAQKLETVGRLAGGIAHDFNNLLGAIIGTVDLVCKELEPSSQAALDLSDVLAVAERAALLSRRLMSFSKQGRNANASVNLTAVVRDLRRLLERVSGERVRLVMEIAEQDCYIWADPIAVEQVIVNLVSNAKDAVLPGGTVTLRVYTNYERIQDGDAGQLPLEFPCHCLEVEDNGSGMDSSTLARLSEPFFTTKPVGKGTGLGLSVVYGVVRQSNGCIRVHSVPGVGTRFRLYFPRHENAPAPEKKMMSLGVRATGNGRTVLVVEDEALLREIVTRILKRRGYEVLVAEDVEEAAFRIRRSSVRPSLLVSDVVLPDGSGSDVHEALNQRWTGIPALFITGYWGEEANRVLQNRSFRLLEKPFTEVQLLDAVERALE